MLAMDYIGSHHVMVRVQCHTYSTVHISFSPHCIVLMVDDFWAAHDVKVPHHVLLNVC